MPETTVTTTEYTDSDGNERLQYRTTVPKNLAEAFDLGGKSLEWSVDSGNALRVEIVDG